MPLYDFQCRACGTEFEALVRAGGAAPNAQVPRQQPRRLLSTFAVSSENTQQAAIKDSRKRQLRTRRDEIAAEETYRKEHEGH